MGDHGRKRLADKVQKLGGTNRLNFEPNLDLVSFKRFEKRTDVVIIEMDDLLDCLQIFCHWRDSTKTEEPSQKKVVLGANKR